MKKNRLLNLLSAAAVAVMAAFALLFASLPGRGFLPLVLLCLIGVVLFYSLCRFLAPKYPKAVKVVRMVFTVCLALGILVLGATEALIIKASFGSPDEEVDYLVVLGAKVNPDGPSVSLQDRIDAAYKYLDKHPDVIAIVSGGKGGDEPMTEAECMFQGLVAKGIDPERIWLEDKATSTWENLHFSLDLIEEKTGQRPEKLGVLSSEYHLFRASLFAQRCGVEFVGVPAATSLPSVKLNHFLREIAGVWHYIILGGQYAD